METLTEKVYTRHNTLPQKEKEKPVYDSTDAHGQCVSHPCPVGEIQDRLFQRPMALPLTAEAAGRNALLVKLL